MVGGTLMQIFKSILFGWLMSFGSKKMLSPAAKSNQRDLEFIVKLVEDGKIKPVIELKYPNFFLQKLYKFEISILTIANHLIDGKKP